MMRILITTLLVSACLFTSRGMLAAQSLADVARKEEERRKSLAEGTARDPREGKDDGKVYTNKDLKGGPGVTGVTAPSTDAPASDAGQTATDAGQAAASPKATEPPATAKGKAEPDAGSSGADAKELKSEADWKGRMKDLRTNLERDQMFAEALQTRINSLTTDFTARDDPAQRGAIATDRQKSIETLARLKEAIEGHKKAIASLEEDARRAGVPPGWLR
jgi:hypothetical protein